MARALSLFNDKTIPLPLSRLNQCRRSPSPMVVAIAQGQSYCASLEAQVEAHLRKAIPIRPPVAVFEPMHHLVFSAPMSKAPALCVAACELVGGHRDQAMAAASALHLMHSAAHTHDHLPLADPKPTTHHSYGTNVELLTGDGIVPFGFELLSRSVDPTQNNSDLVLRVIVEISRAAGSQGIIEGQYRWKDGTKLGVKEVHDKEWLTWVAEKKNGQLHACGAACGAILGGGSEVEIERLRRFGLYVGMIEGMAAKGEEENDKELKEVERLKSLARKELEAFDGSKVGALCWLVE
ncbi:Geranylgeranyl diphosphate synthase [Bertholletia excelsa]